MIWVQGALQAFNKFTSAGDVSFQPSVNSVVSGYKVGSSKAHVFPSLSGFMFEFTGQSCSSFRRTGV